MSRLEELILELCPYGVEYKKIGDLLKLKQIELVTPSIKIKSSEYLEEGITPIISQELEYISGYTNLVDVNIPCDNYVCFGDHSEHIKFIDFAFVQGADGLKIFRVCDNNINIKFLYYVFCNFYIRHNNYERHTKYLKETLIPVPPLPVQEEIVKILDKFTELEAELEAKLEVELEARKKQYEYYKEIILNNNSLKKVRLGDYLLDVKNIKWQQMEDSHLYIDLSSVDREKHSITNATIINKNNAPSRAKQIIHTNDVLFGTTRPMLKRSCFIEKQYNNEICSTGFCVLRANTDMIVPKWIYYMISTKNFYNYVEQNQKGASYPSINDDMVKNYHILLPPMNEQRDIIKLLDKFESITNDIYTGLPAEIKARHKQYEYYRDKLLTFKELKQE